MTGKNILVGIIAGSQRQPQAGSQITNWVQSIIENHVGANPSIKLKRINVKDLTLPFYSEPYPAMSITATEQYTQESTKAWSRQIAPLDAFVVITPEYNVNIPAALKDAIDLLYFEWTKKPFFIISYGTFGGTNSNENLTWSLTMAIKAKVVEHTVKLAYGPPEEGIVTKAVQGKDLGLSVTEDGALWANKRVDITKGWDELISLLKTRTDAKISRWNTQDPDKIKFHKNRPSVYFTHHCVNPECCII